MSPETEPYHNQNPPPAIAEACRPYAADVSHEQGSLQALSSPESVAQVTDSGLLGRLFERAGTIANPQTLAEVMVQNETMLGNILQNPSMMERYAGTREEVEGLKADVNALQQAVERAAFASLQGFVAQEHPDELAAYLRASIGYRWEERFCVLVCDEHGRVQKNIVQHEGSIDHTPAYPREVVRALLSERADACILAHNHPSNQAMPSRPDIDLTKTVQETLIALHLRLLDHVVVARTGHTSFHSASLLPTLSKERGTDSVATPPDGDVHAGMADRDAGQLTIPESVHRTRAVDRSTSGSHTNEAEHALVDMLTQILSDESGSRSIDDEGLFTWLLGRYCATDYRVYGLARPLLHHAGSLGELVRNPECIDTLSVDGHDTAMRDVLNQVRDMLVVLREMTERVMRPQELVSVDLSDWDKVNAYLRSTVPRHEAAAHVIEGGVQRVVYLNRKNHLISDELLEIGENAASNQLVRQVAGRALELHASAVFLIDQNAKTIFGPGREGPTSIDVAQTRDLSNALGHIGIVLHDRLTVNGGKGGHQSYRQLGILPFERT